MKRRTTKDVARDEAGITTAEYAVGTAAGAGFAGLLYTLLTGSFGDQLLTSLFGVSLPTQICHVHFGHGTKSFSHFLAPSIYNLLIHSTKSHGSIYLYSSISGQNR